MFLPEDSKLERVEDLAFQNTKLDYKALHAGIHIAENAFEMLEMNPNNSNGCMA